MIRHVSQHLFFILIVLLSACHTHKQFNSDEEEEVQVEVIVNSVQEAKKPKNVILMIGDGMGVVQISSGMYSQQGLLNLEQIDDLVVGLHKNSSSDRLVTDSAAGATAFACGEKTYNGAIAVNSDTIPMVTLMEIAQEKGLKTGLVATSTITHATPASFAAHNKYRKNEEAIAADMVNSGVNVMIGGGAKFFNNRETDNRNLYEEGRAKGYRVSDYFNDDFSSSLFQGTSKLLYLTAIESPLMASQGRNYLSQACKHTISFLDTLSDKGFFAVLEGSQIDWGGHANNADYIVTEMLDFDQTIGEVAEWVKRDGETLLVITADHETGGFSINYESVRGDSLVTSFTSDYHTASLIPVFAVGPGAEEFTGIYENTEIFHKIKQLMGW